MEEVEGPPDTLKYEDKAGEDIDEEGKAGPVGLGSEAEAEAGDAMVVEAFVLLF